MEKSKKAINVEGGFFFYGGWNFSKSVSVGSAFIREMRVLSFYSTWERWLLRRRTSKWPGYTGVRRQDRNVWEVRSGGSLLWIERIFSTMNQDWWVISASLLAGSRSTTLTSPGISRSKPDINDKTGFYYWTKLSCSIQMMPPTLSSKHLPVNMHMAYAWFSGQGGLH